MNAIGIIPARYASTRFPGKPLVDIAGKTMIHRVYEQALKSKHLTQVIVATDDSRIEKEVTRFGGIVCITSDQHTSGTDRCYEVIEKMNLQTDVIINIQGDEPFIDPEQIDLLYSCFQDRNTQIATLVKEITDESILTNPNIPKVVKDKQGFALYFSREQIPYIRNLDATNSKLNVHTFYQHIGLYGYLTSTLKEITQLSTSFLEQAEALEQLRWIENGYRIKTAITIKETIAIDTPNDLEIAKKHFL